MLNIFIAIIEDAFRASTELQQQSLVMLNLFCVCFACFLYIFLSISLSFICINIFSGLFCYIIQDIQLDSAQVHARRPSDETRKKKSGGLGGVSGRGWAETIDPSHIGVGIGMKGRKMIRPSVAFDTAKALHMAQDTFILPSPARVNDMPSELSDESAFDFPAQNELNISVISQQLSSGHESSPISIRSREKPRRERKKRNEGFNDSKQESGQSLTTAQLSIDSGLSS